MTIPGALMATAAVLGSSALTAAIIASFLRQKPARKWATIAVIFWGITALLIITAAWTKDQP